MVKKEEGKLLKGGLAATATSSLTMLLRLVSTDLMDPKSTLSAKCTLFWGVRYGALNSKKIITILREI